MCTPALSRGLTRLCRPAPAPASLLAALPLSRAARSPVARVPSRSSDCTPPAPPRWLVAPRTLCHRRRASNLRAHGPAPTAAKLQARPRRCLHLLLHLYPCLPPGHPRPRRPLAPLARPLVGLCPACTAQPAHRPRTPLPSLSGAPRPRTDCHAPAASALRAFRPTPAPAFRRAVRACAARSPGALASSRSPRPARSVVPPPPLRSLPPIPRLFRARAPYPRSSTRLRRLWDATRAPPPMPASAFAPAPLLAARPTPSPRAPALAPSRLSGCAHPAPPLWPNAPSRTLTLPPPGHPIPCR